jgi:hypothetical protein
MGRFDELGGAEYDRMEAEARYGRGEFCEDPNETEEETVAEEGDADEEDL